MLDITKRNFLKFVSLLSTQLVLPNKVFSATEGDLDSVTSAQLFPSNIAGKMTSLHDYMSPEELEDANSDNPHRDHSAALKKRCKIHLFYIYLQ